MDVPRYGSADRVSPTSAAYCRGERLELAADVRAGRLIGDLRRTLLFEQSDSRAPFRRCEGEMLLAIIPSDLVENASDMRFTAFRHEGDYGATMPWSGDVMPPIDEPKIPMPE